MGRRRRGAETSRTPRREARCNIRAGSRRRKPPGGWKTPEAEREGGWQPPSEAEVATPRWEADSSAPETVEGRSLEIERTSTGRPDDTAAGQPADGSGREVLESSRSGSGRRRRRRGRREPDSSSTTKHTRARAWQPAKAQLPRWSDREGPGDPEATTVGAKANEPEAPPVHLARAPEDPSSGREDLLREGRVRATPAWCSAPRGVGRSPGEAPEGATRVGGTGRPGSTDEPGIPRPGAATSETHR